MGESTGISWTDATFNPWEGCTKVGPGCDHCYAETRNLRFKGGNWGVGAPRRRTSINNWNEPIRWNRKANSDGKPLWVFCSSLADVFDNEVDKSWRDDLFDLVRSCTNLRWQFVTKRIGNMKKMIPDDWEKNFKHCGVIATIVNQAEADRDIPKLKDTPSAWIGVSYEPALGPIDWDQHIHGLDWLIVGGESGANARAFNPEWAYNAIEAGEKFNVPIFVKQMGSSPIGIDTQDKKGSVMREWPMKMRVQQMPRFYEAGT